MINNPPVLSFKDVRELDQKYSIGERAYSLGYLLQSGFPVPDGFVVSAEAFEQCVLKGDVGKKIDGLLVGIEQLDAAAIKEKSAAIKSLVVDCEIAPKTLEEIGKHFDKLSAAHAFSTFAVRSSAVARKGDREPPRDFFDSFFSIDGREAAISAIKKVWAETFNEKSLMYMVRAGNVHNPYCMAVCVQQTVDADIIGRSATCNPESGDRAKISIDASQKKNPAVKETFSVRRSDFNLEEKKSDCDERSGLSDESAVSLARLALRLEQCYGVPVRLSWCSAENKFFILDADTIADPAAAQNETIRSRFTTGEIMPGTMSPFSRSFIVPLLNVSLNKALNADKKKSGEMEFFGDFLGGLYADSNLLIDNLFSPYKLHPKLFPDCLLAGDRLERRGPSGFIGLVKDFFALEKRLKAAIVNSEKIIKKTESVRDANSIDCVKSKSDAALHVAISDLCRDAVEPICEYWFANRISMFAANSLLRKIIEKADVKERSKLHCEAVQSGRGVKIALDMWKLARLAESIGGIPDKLLEVENWIELEAYLERIEGGELFLKRVRAYLANHGHKSCLGYELSRPLWAEDHREFCSLIIAMIHAGEKCDPPSRRQKAAAKSREAARSLKSGLSIFLRPVFGDLLKLTARVDEIESDVTDLFEKLLAGLKELLLEAGRRFASRKFIQNREDVFFLRLDEIKDLLAMTEFSQKPSEIIETRKLDFADLDSNRATQAIIKIDDKKNVSGVEMNIEGQTFKGVGVSGGLWTGTAHIIENVEDAKNFRPGEVLVMSQAREAFAPLISLAGALVVEAGDFVCDAAEVSRNFGVPCVVGLNKIRALINDGDLLSVNADKGIVEVRPCKVHSFEPLEGANVSEGNGDERD